AAVVAGVVASWMVAAHGWTDYARTGLRANERFLRRDQESTLLIALESKRPATWSELEQIAARADDIHADRTALVAPSGLVSGEDPRHHSPTLVALGPSQLQALCFETKYEDSSGL